MLVATIQVRLVTLTPFDIHAGPGWVSQLTEMGILTFGGFKAVLSGRDKDRKAFIPPEENNGFSRDEGRLGFQTTDVDRLRAFFQRELDWRNITNDDIEAFLTIPIPEQLNMEQAVEPCPQGSGIDANGVVHWEGSQESRYIYIQEPGSETPRPPPHFDYPAGTLWRLDREHLEVNGFRSGEVVLWDFASWLQAASSCRRSAAAGFVEGQTYHLYTLMDMHSYNVENCTFIYPIASP